MQKTDCRRRNTRKVVQDCLRTSTRLADDAMRSRRSTTIGDWIPDVKVHECVERSLGGSRKNWRTRTRTKHKQWPRCYESSPVCDTEHLYNYLRAETAQNREDPAISSARVAEFYCYILAQLRLALATNTSFTRSSRVRVVQHSRMSNDPVSAVKI